MSDIYGTNGDDYISTTDGNDTVDGKGGRDVIMGSAGNDIIDGGDNGYNQVDYQGYLADYSFSLNTDGSIRVEKPGGDVDTLRNIDGIWFNGEAVWKPIEELAGMPDNRAPIAVDDQADIVVGETTEIDVLGNDSDPDGDNFAVHAINGVEMSAGWTTWVEGVGLVTVNANGTLSVESFTEGPYSFEYTICDTMGKLSTATISGNATNGGGENTLPVAIDDWVEAPVGQPTVVNVLDNDSDADGDTLTITEINGVTMQAGWITWVEGVGLVTVNDDGTLLVETFQPGDFSFEYTVSDGNGGTTTATVEGNTGGPTNSTNAVDDAAWTNAGEAVTIDVLNNDIDPEEDTFSVTSFENGANGTVSQGPNGQLIYTPDVGFSGTDTFTYTITDANGATDTATVNVDVQTPNSVDAVNDAATTAADTAVTITVLNNDTDPEGDSFSILNFQNGANGIVTQNANGELIYTPNAGFSGTDTFTYTIQDENGAEDTATVTVTVDEPNAPNTVDAVNDAATTDANTAVAISVLNNDTDPEGDNFSILNFQNGANGTVSQNANGQLVYTPNAGFSGTDTFTYTIRDENGAEDTATVSVTVDEPGTPNTVDAVDDTAETDAGAPVTISVLDNDTDPEGDNFSILNFQNGANGTVSQNANGELIYTPNAGFSGTDTFTYTIQDENGATDTATVTVNVEDPAPTDNSEFNGSLFIDENGNGVRDGNETGAAGVTVQLKDADGSVITTQLTDANGDYSFSGLAAGSYFIGVVEPDGQDLTIKDAFNNGADGIDSDINTATSMSDLITIGEGQTIDVDGGLVDEPDANNASIGDLVFLDANGNGLQDNGEVGVADVTVQLKDANGNVISTQQTNTSGNYSFNGLAAGNYSIGLVTPDGFGITTQNTASNAADTIDSDIDATTGMSDVFALAESEQNTSIDAGLTQEATSSIGDQVFLDLNRDGLQNAGEEGIEDITVTLFDSAGNAVSTTTTDENGNYLFDNLVAGDYRVGVEAPDARFQVFTQQDASNNGADGVDSDVDVNTGLTDVISLGVNEQNLTVDAGIAFDCDIDVAGGSLRYGVVTGAYNPNHTVIAFSATHNNLLDLEDGQTVIGIDYSYLTEQIQEAFPGETLKQLTTGSWPNGQNNVYNVATFSLGFLGAPAARDFVENFDGPLIFEYTLKNADGSLETKKVCFGDYSKDQYNISTPIALDLDGDGEIGVTGETTSHEKDDDAEIGRTVEFDIDGDGDLETIEWFDGSGDGILVDMSKIGEDGSIDGSALFGDEGGKYANGYDKLALHDADGDGQISGDELNTIGLWIDDGDGVLEEGELVSAAEQGIASVSTEMDIVLDDEGRELMQSTATTTDGESIISEDVWFVEEVSIEEGMPEPTVCEEYEDCVA